MNKLEFVKNPVIAEFLGFFATFSFVLFLHDAKEKTRTRMRRIAVIFLNSDFFMVLPLLII